MSEILSSLLSSETTLVFIIIILWVTFFGFWPFTKIFGLSGLVSLWKKTGHLKEVFEKAIRKIPEANTIDKRRLEFVKRYNEIKEYFQNDKSAFSHFWLEFTEQLVEPTEEEPVFQNSVRPEKFFILANFLKQKNINLNLLESMPGILVGLGVLGTFIGLSISLIQVFPYLQEGQKQDLTQAIEILIEGAGVAFFTSVAGLLFSLIFNVISDKRMSILQIKLSEFNSTLEKSLKFVTEEHLLTIHLRKLSQQVKYLENMDENIALKIGDVFDQSIEKMGEKIQEAVSKNNQNISEGFISNLSDKMTGGMEGFVRKQMKHLEETLTVLQNKIPYLIEKLETSQKQNEEVTKKLVDQLAEGGKQAQEQINKSLLDTSQKMKSSFEGITQNLNQRVIQTLSGSSEQIQKILSDFSATSREWSDQTKESGSSFQTQMDQTADKLRSFSDSLKNTVKELNTSTAHSIKSTVEEFNRSVKQQALIVKENEIYIHSLDKLSDQLKNMSSSISETMRKLPDFIEQINQANGNLQEMWGGYEKRFANVDESAKELFERITEGLATISRESAGYINQLYKQSTQVTNSFAQAVEELQEAVENIKTDT